MSVELKPCPFCGGEAEVCSTDSWNEGLYHPEEVYGKFYMRCKGACLRLGITAQTVIAAWNRRANPPDGGNR